MKYFKPSEFSDITKMDPELLRMLDECRERAGIPFRLNSTYRSPEYNATIPGASKNSAHTRGHAVDIICTDSSARFKIIKAALEVGFRRIEAAPTWIHLDNDPSLAQDVIFYAKGKVYNG